MCLRNKSSLLFVLVFILFMGAMEVNAMDTGFETKPLSAEEKNAFIANSNIQLLDKEPTPRPIECFDVNDNHLIAIGQNTTNLKTICVYSNEGAFQYGYTFNCRGSFGLEWDGDNINIYFVRGDVIASVTPNGEVLEVCDVPNTTENNTYINHAIHSAQRIVDDTVYSIRNDIGLLKFFSSSYSKLVVTDAGGGETIIYDVSAKQLAKTIAILFGVALFVCIVIFSVAKQFPKFRA